MSNISAIMPLNIGESQKSNSCALMDVMFASLRKFATPGLFQDFFIITLPSQVEMLREHVKKHADFAITVINEQELLPEIKQYGEIGGWRIQQVLKLAAAQIVKTPYYLTFDPDVICTHPISEEILMPGGKAILQLEPKSHKNWWKSSAHQLKFKPLMKEKGIYVTPAILSTEAVRGLIKELSAKKHWTEKLLQPHMPGDFHQYIPLFRKRHRWSEYTLYHLYLEKHKLVDRYHTRSDSPEVPRTLLSTNTLWNKNDMEEWENWDVDACFSEADKSLFFIVQSSKQIPPEEIWKRVEKYLV